MSIGSHLPSIQPAPTIAADSADKPSQSGALQGTPVSLGGNAKGYANRNRQPRPETRPLLPPEPKASDYKDTADFDRAKAEHDRKVSHFPVKQKKMPPPVSRLSIRPEKSAKNRPVTPSQAKAGANMSHLPPLVQESPICGKNGNDSDTPAASVEDGCHIQLAEMPMNDRLLQLSPRPAEAKDAYTRSLMENAFYAIAFDTPPLEDEDRAVCQAVVENCLDLAMGFAHNTPERQGRPWPDRVFPSDNHEPLEDFHAKMLHQSKLGQPPYTSVYEPSQKCFKTNDEWIATIRKAVQSLPPSAIDALHNTLRHVDMDEAVAVFLLAIVTDAQQVNRQQGVRDNITLQESHDQPLSDLSKHPRT